MQRRQAITSAAVALIVFSVGCSRETRPGEYRNREHNFGIVPPTGWATQKGSNIVVVTFMSPQEGAADAFRENINVVVEKLPRQMTTEEYAKECRRAMTAALVDLETVSDTAQDLNGQASRRYVSTYRTGAANIKSLVYVTAKGKRAYVITCSALPETFGDYEKTFDDCCGTFIVDQR